jgi:hypothetical protein
MVRQLARVVGVGIETADMLVTTKPSKTIQTPPPTSAGDCVTNPPPPISQAGQMVGTHNALGIAPLA